MHHILNDCAIDAQGTYRQNEGSEKPKCTTERQDRMREVRTDQVASFSDIQHATASSISSIIYSISKILKPLPALNPVTSTELSEIVFVVDRYA